MLLILNFFYYIAKFLLLFLDPNIYSAVYKKGSLTLPLIDFDWNLKKKYVFGVEFQYSMSVENADTF